MKTAVLNGFESNEIVFDRLISRSGIIGRQILRLALFMQELENELSVRTKGLPGSGLQQRKRLQLRGAHIINRWVGVLYFYYVGGSLTRGDQITLARLLGMGGNAYRLTLFNAFFFGIPCGLGYFLLGEGFNLLKEVHTYAELPSLFARHASLGIGTISLVVDLFRIIDALWHHRCWAPFGFVPFVINLPTYLKRFFQHTGLMAQPETKKGGNGHQQV